MKTKRGMQFMSDQMKSTVEKVRGGFQVDGYLNVAQLSKATEWKETLKRMNSMQVLDHDKTAGILMSKDAYVAVMDYIDALEEDLDKAHVAALVSARQNMNDWTKGEDLAKKAEKSFLERSEHLKGLVDDDEKNLDVLDFIK